jgi:cephalosporin-C deacetylase-like acetyl esterase
MGLTAAVAASQNGCCSTLWQQAKCSSLTAAGTAPVLWWSAAKDGTRLAGWLMTPPVAGPHPGVVYFGGRSEEVSWVARDAGKLFPGMAVLAVNYRGYGDSHGDPAENISSTMAACCTTG